MTLNPHLRSHLLAFWLAVAAVVLGCALIVAPTMGESSPSLAIMPDWGVIVWGAWFAVGGGSVVYGLVGMRRRFEAAGSVLLSASYFSAAVASVYAGSSSPLGLLFLSAIAIGFLHRSYWLSHNSAAELGE